MQSSEWKRFGLIIQHESDVVGKQRATVGIDGVENSCLSQADEGLPTEYLTPSEWGVTDGVFKHPVNGDLLAGY